jgi:hypothetical protein
MEKAGSEDPASPAPAIPPSFLLAPVFAGPDFLV